MRLVLTLFFALMLCCAGAFVWLGAELLEQDRAAERQRRRERLESAAARVAADLQLALARGDAQVRVTPAGTVVTPPGALPYAPVEHSPSPELPAAFAAAEAREFSGDPPVDAYLALARDGVAETRAAALVRAGRVLRRLGRRDESDRVYRELEKLGATAVEGMPAGLVALGARGDAGGLRAALAAGRWVVDRATYEVYAGQAGAMPAPAGLRMAELIDDAWRRRTVGRRYLDGHVVAVETGEGSWSATVTGPATLRSAVAGAGRRAGVAVSLGGAGEYVMAEGASGLPVPLGISIDGAAETGGGRRRLYLAGLAVFVVLIAGGTAFIGRAMQRELAVARLQADFVAAVSHEFRTPLTSIRQLTELLAKGRIQDPAQVRKSYELMMSESDRLKRLIESLLDFGRMQSGTYRFRREPLELNAFTGDVVAAFGGEVALAVEAEPVWVKGDREALRGVLWNLLENAVKYSPGGARVRVEVGAVDGSARVAVADAGMGIPKAEQGRIFDRFYRGEAARSGGMKGTGIGLAMVREVMAGHGGRVRVESEVGKGSTFTLELPLGREA